jgi:hypothetical protein
MQSPVTSSNANDKEDGVPSDPRGNIGSTSKLDDVDEYLHDFPATNLGPTITFYPSNEVECSQCTVYASVNVGSRNSVNLNK